MKYLMAQYGRIMAADIKMKKQFLQEPVETSQMINAFFSIINYGVQYFSEANTPFMPAQLLQMAYHYVISYGVYTYYFKDWSSNLSA